MDTAKLLYRRLDSLFSALDPKKTQPQQLELFLEEAFAQLKDDLRLKAGLLYSEHRDDFTLAKTVGDPGGRVAESLDPAAGPLHQVFRHRVYIFGDPNAEIAPYRLVRPPRRGLDDGGAGLRAQHGAGGPRLAPGRRAGAGLLPRGGGDPAEPARRGTPGLPGLPDRLPVGPRRRGGRRLLRLPPLQRRHAGPRHRRCQRPRAARRPPGARRGDRPAHGNREGAEDHSRLREAQPRDPPQQPLEPVRERVLRRAGGEREPHLRERGPPAAHPVLREPRAGAEPHGAGHGRDRHRPPPRADVPPRTSSSGSSPRPRPSGPPGPGTTTRRWWW